VLTAFILLGVCQILAPFGAFFVLRWYIERKQTALEEWAEAAVHEWIDQPEPGKPSKVAEMIGMAGGIVGTSAAKSIMFQLNQQNTSVTQVANSIADPLAARQNPLTALLGGGRKGKNAAVLRLAELIGPMLGGGNGQGIPVKSGTDTPMRKQHRE